MVSIICADDDEYMRDLYRTIFSQRGDSTRVFDNGGDAFEAFREQSADLLILDIDMPGDTGLEVCVKLRKSVDGFNVPIILVTGRGNEEDIVHGLDVGATDYIVKPFSPPVLLAKVNALMQRRRTVGTTELALPLGARFAGRYEIVSKVGSGGFSSVYRARDMNYSPHRDVALKIFKISPSVPRTEQRTNIFKREGALHKKLRHPHIVTLHDFGDSKMFHYLLMEYVVGETLQSAVEREGKLPESYVVPIAYGIATALQYIREQGVVHGDITPHNIICSQNGTAKLLDFGLARHVADQALASDGDFLGTLDFAAPECVWQDEKVDGSADVYSLGATLYYTITGTLPIPVENKMEDKPMQSPCPSSSLQCGNGVTASQFAQLISRMIRFDKNTRPTIDEIVLALERNRNSWMMTQ